MCKSYLSQYRLKKLELSPIHKLVPASIINDLNAVERYSWSKWYDQNAVNIVSAKAETRRACISHRSQRDRKFRLIPYKVAVYQNLTQIQQVHHRLRSKLPPARSDKPIITFTKRSRQTLMNKFRKMRRETDSYTKIREAGRGDNSYKKAFPAYNLQLPYFVTLTYHENYTDPAGAKKHLNTWFQRLRRIYGVDLRYFWKMEFQHRGAIHFHLALYIDAGRLPLAAGVKYSDDALESIKKYISRSWAEVTAAVNGFTGNTSRLGRYTVKSYYINGYAQNVKTRNFEKHRNYIKRYENAGAGSFQNAGIWHKNYGTNVRSCQNWKMAAGYMSKYLGKECESLIDQETGEVLSSGRFWGFSNNFNFEAFYMGVTNESDLKKLQDFANSVNDEMFMEFSDQISGNIKREKTGKNRRGKIKKMQKSLIKQKRRYQINKFKIFNPDIEWWNLVKRGVFKASYKDYYVDRDPDPALSSPANLQFETDYKKTLDSIKKTGILLLDPAEFENVHGSGSIDIDIKDLY